MSLVNLSRYFEAEGWECFYMVKNYNAAINLLNKNKITNIEIIKESISISQEVEYLNIYTAENKIDMVFFEITERKLSEYHGLSKNIQKVCVCFDGYIPNDIDIVIDWDVQAGILPEPQAPGDNSDNPIHNPCPPSSLAIPGCLDDIRYHNTGGRDGRIISCDIRFKEEARLPSDSPGIRGSIRDKRRDTELPRNSQDHRPRHAKDHAPRCGDCR